MPQHGWTDGASSSGVGIAGMKARVAQFGGTIDFPNCANGTTVFATIPLPENIDLVPAPGLRMDAARSSRAGATDH